MRRRANGSETEEREGGTESGDVGSGKLFSLHVEDLFALLFFFVRRSSLKQNLVGPPELARCAS